MWHLALNPLGLGVLVGAGGLLFLQRNGVKIAGLAGTVVGSATEVASRGLGLLGLKVERVEEKTEKKSRSAK